MVNGKNKLFFLMAAAFIVFSGCQTTRKDLIIARADEKVYWNLGELEETIIRLDGGGAGRDEIARARQQVSSLQGTVADPDFEAHLAAWSGRLYLMEGRTADAQREYRRSQSLSSLNIPSLVLSFRLEQNPSRRLSMINQSLDSSYPQGEFLVEKGRVLFDLNRFAESVAAFDASFIVLNGKPWYQESYKVFRDKAWELKDLQQGAVSRTVEIAGQGEITWKDLIEITRNETDLLRFITAGRDWPVEALFSQLLERSFFPITQDTALTEWPLARPSSEDIVLRSGAAWFLWHLNAENRANRGLLTQYSARLANTPNARSPVLDLDIWSPFLDSVLGCVEWEIMSLPDGRNFHPSQRVKGSDFLAMLKKL